MILYQHQGGYLRAPSTDPDSAQQHCTLASNLYGYLVSETGWDSIRTVGTFHLHFSVTMCLFSFILWPTSWLIMKGCSSLWQRLAGGYQMTVWNTNATASCRRVKHDGSRGSKRSRQEAASRSWVRRSTHNLPWSHASTGCTFGGMPHLCPANSDGYGVRTSHAVRMCRSEF